MNIEPASTEGEDARWLHWLNAQIFPDDTPMVLGWGHWRLVWLDGSAIAFCGWKPRNLGGEPCGFHYRAGVLPRWRGQGLQRRMVAVREKEMVDAGKRAAVTYTETYSAASMRSFMAEGYKPYWPEAPHLSAAPPDRWMRMVHWRKELT